MRLTRETGYLLATLGVIFLIIAAIYAAEWYDVTNKSCEMACGELHEVYCTHRGTLPIHIYAGITLALLMAGIGGYLALKGPSGRAYAVDSAKLDGDEAKIAALLKENEGVMFQSDIVEKTGFSKSKVSRILDKMEARGLVERRRRGMTNVVILK